MVKKVNHFLSHSQVVGYMCSEGDYPFATRVTSGCNWTVAGEPHLPHYNSDKANIYGCNTSHVWCTNVCENVSVYMISKWFSQKHVSLTTIVIRPIYMAVTLLMFGVLMFVKM